MKLEHRRDGWWITGVPEYSLDGSVHREYGPYGTKAEAEDDRRGVQRTLDVMEGGFVEPCE